MESHYSSRYGFFSGPLNAGAGGHQSPILSFSSLSKIQPNSRRGRRSPEMLQMLLRCASLNLHFLFRADANDCVATRYSCILGLAKRKGGKACRKLCQGMYFEIWPEGRGSRFR